MPQYTLPPWLEGNRPADLAGLMLRGYEVGSAARSRDAELQERRAAREQSMLLEQARIANAANAAAQQVQLEEQRMKQAAEMAALESKVRQEQIAKQFELEQQRNQIEEAYKQQQVSMRVAELDGARAKIAEDTQRASRMLAIQGQFAKAFDAAQTDEDRRKIGLVYSSAMGLPISAQIPKGVGQDQTAAQKNADEFSRIMNEVRKLESEGKMDEAEDLKKRAKVVFPRAFEQQISKVDDIKLRSISQQLAGLNKAEREAYGDEDTLTAIFEQRKKLEEAQDKIVSKYEDGASRSGGDKKRDTHKAGTRIRQIATGRTATLKTDGEIPDGFELLQ